MSFVLRRKLYDDYCLLSPAIIFRLEETCPPLINNLCSMFAQKYGERVAHFPDILLSSVKILAGNTVTKTNSFSRANANSAPGTVWLCGSAVPLWAGRGPALYVGRAHDPLFCRTGYAGSV